MKPRKPRPLKEYGKYVLAYADSDCAHVLQQDADLRDSKRLHAWLGDYIAWAESEKIQRKVK